MGDAQREQNFSKHLLKRISNTFIPEESIESQWRIKDLDEFLKENYKLETDIENIINNDKKLLPESIASIVIEKAKQYYKDKYNLVIKYDK